MSLNKFVSFLILCIAFKISIEIQKTKYDSILYSNKNNLLLNCRNTRVIFNLTLMEEMCFINLSGNRGCHSYELLFKEMNKHRVPCTLTALIPNSNQINAIEIFGGGEENSPKYIEVKYNLDEQFLRLNTTLNISLHSVLDTYFLENITHIIFTEIKTGMAQHFLNFRFRAPNLQHLALVNSEVQHFNFTRLTQYHNLTELHLHGIQLENITLNKDILAQLSVLNISKSNLKNIYWEGKREFVPSSLRNVDLSSNKLEEIPEFFVSALKDIKNLNLRGNKIATAGCSFYYLAKFLFKLDADVFIKADFNSRAIAIPRLHHCSWRECPFLCACNASVKTVDCSDRELSLVPEIIPSESEILLLQDNKITIEGLSHIFQTKPWCNIRHINLARNDLAQILPEPKIQGVCECKRKIYSARPTFCFLPNLTNLKLSENAITDFSENDWKLISRCPTVDLSRNKISENAFRGQHDGYTKIQSLNLSFNRLRFLTKDVMKLFPFIVQMNLSSNRLKEINFNLTSLTPLLQVLDLSNNVLQTISPAEEPSEDTNDLEDPYTISLPSLKGLYLHNNYLRGINPSLWHSLQYLTLRNNKWQCDYKTVTDMQYFIWQNLEPNVVAEFKELKCQNGTYLQDIKIPPGYDKKQHCVEKSFILISCTIAIFAVTTFFGSSLWKYFAFYFKKYIFHRKVQNDVAEREHDVFVYYCDEDTENVNRIIISEILRWELKVIHPKDFIFGASNLDQFKEALSSSRRMVAIISENFFNDKFCIFGLRKGMEEEVLVKKFKIACFNIDNIQIPVHIDSSIRGFLECKCIKHYPQDMWKKNLKKFIEVGKDRSRKLSVPIGNENLAFDTSSC